MLKKQTREKKLRKARRLGIVPVSIEVMAQHLLEPKFGVEVIGLPDDAIFLEAFHDPLRYGLNFVYAHESFNKVKVGEVLPILDVYYRETRTVTAPPIKRLKDKEGTK